MNEMLHALTPLDSPTERQRRRWELKDFMRDRRTDAREVMATYVFDELCDHHFQDKLFAAMDANDDTEVGRLIRAQFEHGVRVVLDEEEWEAA